ncbi:MAG: NifB/NifX family molybdenum-iron cluster-binding protein [Desulfobacterales bacterium]
MKIAVSSTGKNLEATLDARFGRAAYFVVVDPDTLTFEAVENKQNLNLPQGAGIQAAKTVLQHNADALITGNCGPKAFKVLEAAGIKVYVGVSGRVRDIVDQFKKGVLSESSEPNVEGHWV